MAGYSGTPLAKKLGIKPGAVMYVSHPPSGYFDWLSPLPENIQVKLRPIGTCDFLHAFVTTDAAFKKEFLLLKNHLHRNGMLWISWPKKASGVNTDLDGNKIRNFGLQNGLVDVKVCAVDETWSALKFVFRLEDRG